jgi:DNA-binding NarL/FixJ family response regulator
LRRRHGYVGGDRRDAGDDRTEGGSVTMSPTDHVLMTLGVQASAQREIAKHVTAKAPEADALIAGHHDTAHLCDLLREAVAAGLLDDLEAAHATR